MQIDREGAPASRCRRRRRGGMACVLALVLVPGLARAQTAPQTTPQTGAQIGPGGLAPAAPSTLPSKSTPRAAFPPATPLSPGPESTASSRRSSSSRLTLVRPFVDVVGDFRRFPSWQNVQWLSVGLGAAAAIHPSDRSISREWSETGTGAFRPGAVIGLTPVQLGAALATYTAGLAAHSPRTASLGADLIRAQLLADVLTRGIKGSVRRDRPDGGGFSFPSGHASVSFASATVLQRHLGWKVGIPAYAAAAYVAASRVQMKRHYLSDVAFGAALGIVAGRTVTLGNGHRLLVAPMASTDGAGLSFVWLGGR